MVNYVERFIRRKRIVRIVIKLFVDGGTKGSVICLVDPQRKKKIVKTRKGKLTNNDLEYLAIIYGIEYARKYYPKEPVEIKSDSMLAVKQINHQWNIKGDNLISLKKRVEGKRTKLISIHWIPREFNLAGIYLEGLGKSSSYHHHTLLGV